MVPVLIPFLSSLEASSLSRKKIIYIDVTTQREREREREGGQGSPTVRVLPRGYKTFFHAQLN